MLFSKPKLNDFIVTSTFVLGIFSVTIGNNLMKILMVFPLDTTIQITGPPLYLYLLWKHGICMVCVRSHHFHDSTVLDQ